MFDGFELRRMAVGDVILRFRHGGVGPPVVLLHGHPRTHATWHRLAPLLAVDHTVICPDLRGYGGSTTPQSRLDHAQQSKRAMAADVVALARALGHPRFAVVGHDRGAYVAFRAALDHPHVVTRLAILDAIPIVDALERCDSRFAAAWWHWFFFAQADKPERAILADPRRWYGDSPEKRRAMGLEAWADYDAAIHDPLTVHAMLEDYRAGLGVDRAHDAADRAAGRRIGCPVLLLWAARDDLESLHGDPMRIWRAWADDLRGGPIDSGHHMAEEAPGALHAALHAWLTQG